MPITGFPGGSGEIRTLEDLSTLPPFQGGALDHYATPPCRSYTIIGKGDACAPP